MKMKLLLHCHNRMAKNVKRLIKTLIRQRLFHGQIIAVFKTFDFYDIHDHFQSFLPKLHLNTIYYLCFG